MSEYQLIHVKVYGADKRDVETIRDIVSEPLQDYAGEGEIIVSDENLDIRESDLDELSELVAKKLED